MRTTISIDDALLATAKQVAAETGRSLSAVVDEALQESLRRRHEPGRAGPVMLPEFGGRLLPGVDLDDSRSLGDLMDEPS
jgi:hypothetical protein